MQSTGLLGLKQKTDIARDDRRLNKNDKLTYYTLASYADNALHSCFPSLDTLEEATGLSRPTLIAALEHLAQLGYLTVSKRKDERTKRQQVNVYHLHAPVETESRVKPVDSGRGEPSQKNGRTESKNEPEPSKAALPELVQVTSLGTRGGGAAAPPAPEPEIDVPAGEGGEAPDGGASPPLYRCPACKRHTLIHNDRAVVGWICLRRAGGCGAEFEENEPNVRAAIREKGERRASIWSEVMQRVGGS